MTERRIDDADIDEFVAKFFTRLNPDLTAEERADAIHAFVLDYVELTEPEKSKEWVTEFARRVRGERCG